MPKTGADFAVPKSKVERMPRAAGPFSEIDRLFEQFLGRRLPRGWDHPIAELAGGFGPNVDVIDRDEEVLVRAELPGYKKDDVEVSVSGNMLTLKGDTVSEQNEEKGDYHRAEITRGAFSRTLSLPAEVDEAQARAVMKDGMLELTLPKLQKARRRTINIS